MNVDVRIQSADLKGALGTYIKRCLHFALGRFTGKLGRVSVRIEDIPRAGDVPDASCRIRVELLPNGQTLRQEAVDRNLYIAIDLAIERIVRTFERELDWVRSFGKARNPESVASHSRKRSFK
jgi:ribosome-associated translation inhibitor RaiA